MGRVYPPLIALAAGLFLWAGGVRLFDVPPLILPGPGAVGAVLVSDFTALLHHTALTLSEALAGFALGGAAAWGLGLLFVRFKPLQAALYPWAVALKAVPLIILAPLLIVWLGDGWWGKAVMAALVSFFPVLVGTVSGLDSVSRAQLDLMRGLAASPWQEMFKLRVPASLEQTFAGLKVAATLAVVGAVIGEFAGAQAGIGHVVKSAAYYLDTARVLAAAVMIAAGGMAFFGAVVLAERRILRLQRSRLQRSR